MKLIICVDNNMGMSFNNRRQSTDSKIGEYLLNMVEQAGTELTITDYSRNQFLQSRIDLLNIKHSDLLFDDEPITEFVFVENPQDFQMIDWNSIDRLILCFWNRSYPADSYFCIPDGISFKLDRQVTLKGSSHPEITIEEYIPNSAKEL